MSDPDSAQILVVDDARDIRDPLGQYLRRSGFRTRLAASAEEARAILGEAVIHLVILDIMMPGETGMDFLDSLPPDHPPVLMLSARTEEDQIVAGLERGAEDYLTKPFSPRELLARIRVILRRWPPTQPSPTLVRRSFAGLQFDPAARRVTRPDGAEVRLTSSEARMLTAFLDNPGEVLSRVRLLDLIWGREAKAYDRAIDNTISRLRRKIGDDARPARLLVTDWGGGYQLMAEVDQTEGDQSAAGPTEAGQTDLDRAG